MNVYRIVLKRPDKRPDGEFTKYHILYRKANSGKKLRKEILRKLEPTNWTLKSFSYDGEATYIRPEYPYKKSKRNY